MKCIMVLKISVFLATKGFDLILDFWYKKNNNPQINLKYREYDNINVLVNYK